MAADTFEQEEFLTGIGEVIRHAREARGMTQAELANRIGMSRPSVSNIEAGRVDFMVSRLENLAAALGLDLGDLR